MNATIKYETAMANLHPVLNGLDLEDSTLGLSSECKSRGSFVAVLPACPTVKTKENWQLFVGGVVELLEGKVRT
jgi:hypothetical protein